MIADGRVKIDGVVVTTPATILTTLHGLTVDDKQIKAPEAARLFVFHKPAGLLTAERDPQGRPTIYSALRNSLPAGIPPQLQFFVPAIDADSTPDDYDGMFDTDNPANPIRDWSIVYIPYCTGDLHTGSSTRTYTQPTPAPGVPYNPYIPASFPIRHGGFDNFMVVMDWMKKNIDKPRNVLVTGSSAGGYGAIANFPWIERAFRNAHTYGTMASGPPGPAPINSDTSFKSIEQSYQQTS